MKKLLRPQDVLLLGLSGAIDLFNDLKDPFGLMGNAYENVYGWVPKRFKKTNYLRLVQRSLRTGYIEKVIHNGQPVLRITSIGREKIQRNFPLARLQNKRWDKKWRVVIFDIKEKQRQQRDLLRNKLKEIGFGMIQESVWISPYDVALDFREFIKSIGLEEEVFVMEVCHLLAGDSKKLVAKIWGLKKLNREYKELFDMLLSLKLHDRDKTLTDENERIEKLRRLREEYLEILRDDPCLPKELLPEDWYGEKVKRILLKVI